MKLGHFLLFCAAVVVATTLSGAIAYNLSKISVYAGAAWVALVIAACALSAIRITRRKGTRK